MQKYAHNSLFGCILLWLSANQIDFILFYPSVYHSDITETFRNVDEMSVWIYYNAWYNHNKTKRTKTFVCLMEPTVTCVILFTTDTAATSHIKAWAFCWIWGESWLSTYYCKSHLNVLLCNNWNRIPGTIRPQLFAFSWIFWGGNIVLFAARISTSSVLNMKNKQLPIYCDLRPLCLVRVWWL